MITQRRSAGCSYTEARRLSRCHSLVGRLGRDRRRNRCRIHSDRECRGPRRSSVSSGDRRTVEGYCRGSGDRRCFPVECPAQRRRAERGELRNIAVHHLCARTRRKRPGTCRHIQSAVWSAIVGEGVTDGCAGGDGRGSADDYCGFACAGTVAHSASGAAFTRGAGDPVRICTGRRRQANHGNQHQSCNAETVQRLFWHDFLLDDWGGGLLSSLLCWLDYVFAFRADTKTHTQPQLNLFAEISARAETAKKRRVCCCFCRVPQLPCGPQVSLGVGAIVPGLELSRSLVIRSASSYLFGLMRIKGRQRKM